MKKQVTMLLSQRVRLVSGFPNWHEFWSKEKVSLASVTLWCFVTKCLVFRTVLRHLSARVVTAR